MLRCRAAGTICALLVGGVAALDNGVGLTPAMGFNTWYSTFMHTKEQDVKQVISKLQETGLQSAGYKYLNLDDGVFQSRDPSTGRLVVNAEQFPSGLQQLSQAVHAAGFLFGIYTDRGNQTCGGRPGSLGYEAIDAKLFADLGVDFLKEDSCNAAQDHPTAWLQYSLMRDALNATGRPVHFNLCGWNAWYAPVGAKLGNSWRTARDDVQWAGVLANIDAATPLSQFGGPGGFNDLDYLLFRDASGQEAQTELQTRTQFSIYSVLAAPLIISQDLTRSTPFVLETLLNKEVIAVDQDILGQPGRRLVGEDLQPCAARRSGACVNIFGRRLANGDWAFVFVNAGSEDAAHVTLEGPVLSAATGWEAEQRLVARDLWAHADGPPAAAAGGLAVPLLPKDGGVAMFRVRPVFGKQEIVI